MSPVAAIGFNIRLKLFGWRLSGGSRDTERKMAANDLMDGFPPPPDRLVTLSNWRKAPFSAWGFRNVRRLVPTADIPASGRSVPLETSLEDIGDVGFTGHDGEPMTVSRALSATSTDAFIVLRRGRVAAE